MDSIYVVTQGMDYEYEDPMATATDIKTAYAVAQDLATKDYGSPVSIRYWNEPSTDSGHWEILGHYPDNRSSSYVRITKVPVYER